MAYGAIPERPGSLLRVLDNKELDKMDDEKRKEANPEASDPVIQSVAAMCKRYWDAAKNAKMQLESRLIKCYRQKKGQYEPEDLNKIKQFGGSDIYMMLTNIKCRTIESWIKDVMLPAGEKPWSITPTPVPSLPEESVQKIMSEVQAEVQSIMSAAGPDAVTTGMIDERLLEKTAEYQREQKKLADKECERVEQLIEDELQEGDFYVEMSKFIKDFAIYPGAFLKGPVVSRRLKLVWENMPDGGAVPAAKYKTVRRFYRVSPYDMYMSPGARSIHDGYTLERMRLRASDIYELKNVPGVKNELIDEILDDAKNGGNMKDWLWTDQERANLNNRPNEQDDPQAQIEALEFNGEIPAQLLIEWGMDEDDFEDPKKPIPCTVLMIKDKVPLIKLNSHPLGKKPYYVASFDPSNEGIWGDAPPELMEDCQRVCNAAARSVVNNVALGSGPQVEIHKDRIDPGDDSQSIYPWKIWRTKSDTLGHGRNAVYFFQPQVITQQLLEVYNHFFGQASEQLGVPAYESGVGSQTSGAGDTAHGLSMLMSAASKIIKEAIVNIDTNVLKGAIQNVWVHMMLFDDIKSRGDINVVPRASEYLIIAETLRARRAEFLSVTNNPTDMQIIGIKGRANILRETARTLKMSEKIVPESQELEAEIQKNVMELKAQAMAAMASAGGGPPPGAGGGGGPPTRRGPTDSNPLSPQLEKMSEI